MTWSVRFQFWNAIILILMILLGMTYAWVDMRTKMVRIHVTLQLATIAPCESEMLKSGV